jgi:hypothetical protein
MTILHEPQFAGVLRALRPVAADDWDSPAEDEPGQDKIEDDIEGEQETLAFDDVPDLVPPDDEDGDTEDEESVMGDDSGSDGDAKMNDLRAVIQEVSKGVVESTDAEYRRYSSTLIHFDPNCLPHMQGSINNATSLFTTPASSRRKKTFSQVSRIHSRQFSLLPGL